MKPNRMVIASMAALVLVIGGLMYLLVRPSLPPRTELSDDANLQPIELPTSPSSVYEMNRDGDAAIMYRDAIRVYKQDQPTYDDFIKEPHASDLPNLEAGLKPLLDASTIKEMKLFRDHPHGLINYTSEQPDLDAITTIGRCAVRAAIITRQDDPVTAMMYAQAAFSLGVKLFNERVTYSELQSGAELMNDSAHYVAQIADAKNEKGLASIARQFSLGQTQYLKQHVMPLLGAIRSIDQNVMDEHAGDIFSIAKQSKEPMWRVEALLALGRYRFAGNRNDQKLADQMVNDLAAREPDSTVREAAIEARDLTVEQFRMLH